MVRIILVRQLLVDRDLVVTAGRARLIWGVSAIGGALALVVVLTSVRSLPAPPHHFPFLVLIGLFALSDLAVVHVEVGSQSHTFSLVEVPLVLGLLAERPSEVVVAWLAGAAMARTLGRRQAPIKLAYNLMSFALEAVAAVLIFHAFSNGRNLLAGSTFAGVFAATLASSIMGIVTVFGVVALAEGDQPRAEKIQHVTFGLASTAVITSTMLIGVVLEATDAPSLWLLGLPIAGVYVAERMFTNQVREHRRLQLLRRSSELVAGLGTEESVTSLLRQICHTLNCDVAALVYLPGDIPDSLALSVFGPSGDERGLALVPREDRWDRWLALAPGRDPRLVVAPGETLRLGELIGHPRLRQAMIVPLFGDLSVIGYLTVADRLSDVSAFSSEDLHALEMLERFVSIGLENGHLERSLEEARLLERQLVHRASHDGLTGLANRTMFADHLERVLADADHPELACLFVDLDNFKAVNDGYGHSTGDQLLVVTAQRLVGCLRDGDMAARLGGDELAVIAQVGDAAPGLEEAAALGERIVAALSRPATVGSETVTTSASVGIFLVRPGDGAPDVLASADAAMYSAKKAGKGRVALYERDPVDI